MTEQVPLEYKPVALPSERLIAGKYEVIEEIARGGCSRVLKVRQVIADKLMAVKVLPPGSAGEAALQRLRREAQILGQLKHPNLVNVYAADFDEQVGFIVVMDLLDGVPLSKRLAQYGKLPVELAAKFAMQICDGLQFAHERGIIHRDLKPSNIMIVGSGDQQRIVLIDFGIAKMQDADQRLTRTGSILGTPLYMPPEQFRGTPLEPRSDIYSVGCVLYQMVTGQLPFEGETVLEIAAKQSAQRPVAPCVLNREVSPQLSDLILRCMSVEPERRYQSAAELKSSLAKCNLDPKSALKQNRRKIMLPAIAVSVAAFGFVAGIGFVLNHSASSAVVRHSHDYDRSKPQTLLLSTVVSAKQNKVGDLTNDNQLDAALAAQNEILADKKFWQIPANAYKLPIAYHMRARIYRLLGRYEEAAADLAMARSQADAGHPLPQVLYEEPFIDMRSGRYDLAIRKFDDLIRSPQLSDFRPECFEARTECYLFRGDGGREALEAADGSVSTRDSGFTNSLTWNIITKLTRVEIKLQNGAVESAGEDLESVARSVETYAPPGTLDCYRFWQASAEIAAKRGDKPRTAKYAAMWHRLDADADNLRCVNEDQRHQNALFVAYLRQRMADLHL